MPRKKTTPEQSLHYWRCYAKDIETSVRFRLLSWAGQGMAWRLFNLQFLNGQIPVDPSQIARMLGAGESEFLREWPSLEEFFPVSESGGRRNPRQEEERDHCLGIIKTRREVAGGKSDPVEPEGTAIGVPNDVPIGASNDDQEVQQVPTRTKNQEPRTINQEEEGDKPRPRTKKVVVPFTPPTQEEVMEYMQSRGWKEPLFYSEKWVDHYQPDWKIRGGKPMTDWQRAVRTWEEPSRMKKTAGSAHPEWDL
jgi:hypothetical protein